MIAYRGLLIGAAIGILAGGGAVYLHLRASPPDGQADARGGPATEAAAPRADRSDPDRAFPGESAEVAALRREVEALRTAVASLRGDLSRIEARRAAPPAAEPGFDADEFPGQDDGAWEQQVEAARQRLQQHFDGLEAAHRNEYQDAKWSAAAASQINEALAAEAGFGTLEVYDVDCRATRCRLEIWFDEDTDIDEVEMALAGSVADAPRMAIQYPEDTPADTPEGALRRAIVYLGREDADFSTR